MKRILSIVFVLAFASAAFAQSPQATPVQQTAQDLQGCTTSTATAAVGSAATLTITPPNGMYVYLCGLDLTISQNGTGSAHTNLQYTSTNLGGWQLKYSLVGTASSTSPFVLNFARPVKSAQAGTAVTIVSPAGQTNSAYSITGYYYFAQ